MRRPASKQRRLRSKLLVVGINPSAARPDKVSMSISRLYSWMNRMGIDMFSFTNCIARPGPYKYNDIDFDFLAKSVEGYDKVIALGNFPSRALRDLHISHFVLPHPSGLNRKLNDKSYEDRVIGECIEYISS
jgi:hypothetical protein